MEARFTSHTVEVFENGKRVASHLRSFAPYLHTTIKKHMPKSHQAHLEWTPSRLINWAETVGAATALVIALARPKSSTLTKSYSVPIR